MMVMRRSTFSSASDWLNPSLTEKSRELGTNGCQWPPEFMVFLATFQLNIVECLQ